MKWYPAVLTAVSVALVLFGASALFYKQFFKRFYDIVLSSLAIIFLSPLMVALIIIGAVKMRGNPFFVQKRPGKISKRTGKEKIFNLIKFRTMSNKRDKSGKLLPDKERLTKYGRALRNTSLDELPELFNIFVGDMSIIGPRPQLVRDMVFMDADQRKRHSVRPGLSGLAQVNGRNAINWEKKFEYDLLYIDNGVSLFGDISIIVKTIIVVLKRSNTVREGTVSDIDFGDALLISGKIGEDEYNRKQDEALQLLGG